MAFAFALMLAVVPMLWTSATPAHDALLLLSVALSAALVCAVAFSWGATRWFDRRVRSDEHRLGTARDLGRTPYIAVSPTPGWFPE